MKKLLAIIIIAAVLLLNATASIAAGQDNTAGLSSGIVALAYNADPDSKLKVMIEKDGKKVTFNLRNDGVEENFPLSMGNGEYKVSILENIIDNQYKYVKTEKVNLELTDEKQVFLNSVQNVNWNRDMAAIAKADELVKGIKGNSQKILVIYDYIVNNISYDYEKLSNLPNSYVPDIDKTILNRKGICYDYSSTFAAMLRSQGIPAKLVKGYSTNVQGYHAWNEVFNSETSRWVVIDTTYDSQMKKEKSKFSMEKKTSLYDKVYEY